MLRVCPVQSEESIRRRQRAAERGEAVITVSLWLGTRCYRGLHRVRVFIHRLFGRDEGVGLALARMRKEKP